MRSSIFHLAIPCADLDKAQSYYIDGLGCRMARRYNDRITIEFFGDQVVCHLKPDGIDKNPELYPRHFGHTFVNKEDFDDLLARIKEKDLPFFMEPFTRFKGMQEEHLSFVIQDPSNNLLEFKYYYDPEMIY